MILEQILDRGALKAEPGQSPTGYKNLTTWEKQVLNNPDRFHAPKNVWDRKTRRDFVARWGGLPKTSQPVQTATDRMAAGRQR